MNRSCMDILEWKDRVHLRLIRTIHYLFHRKGHHVHSPYVFHLITRVVEERLPYYCFSTLAMDTRERRQSSSYRGIQRQRVLEFIFRLAVWGKYKRALISSSEDSIVGEYLRVQGIKTEFAEITVLPKDHKEPLLIILEHEPPSGEYSDGQIWEHLPNGSVLLLHCPCRKGPLYSLWLDLKKNPHARVGLDLGDVFLFVFDRNLNKRMYRAFL